MATRCAGHWWLPWQVLGFVEPALALRRSGARPGDVLYVSGSPGEAAAGLDMLRRGASMESDDPLVNRYLYAQPRLELGRALRGRASAAMDVSDGLLGDLGKLCAASGVGATLDLDALPVSDRLLAAYGREAAERLVLLGGDDYELLFALPSADADRGEAELGRDYPITRIGQIETGSGVLCERGRAGRRGGGRGLRPLRLIDAAPGVPSTPACGRTGQAARTRGSARQVTEWWRSGILSFRAT